MASKTRYEVTAVKIVAKVPGADGGEVYLSRGQLLPATVEAAEAKRLLALGLVKKAEVYSGEPDTAPAEPEPEPEPAAPDDPKK